MVSVPERPQRIVSLVPSQTELLFDLGLEKEVVGITKFCIHPDHWFRSKARVGGTKAVHLDRVRVLQPDLIIANKEENVQEQVEALAAEFPVWTSDVNDLSEALSMIRQVGVITAKSTEGESIALDVEKKFHSLAMRQQGILPLRAAYLIWKDPYMSAGGNTYISEMMKTAGLTNVFEGLKRYPQVTVEDLQAAAPQVLLLSSEPYPFKEKHVMEWSRKLPATVIKLVDGEPFSWYGSRLLHAPEYFLKLREELGPLC